MPEQDRNIKEKTGYFPGLLDAAFDLASGGMGIHLRAVADFAARRELAKWEQQSLGQSSSNYLVNPYVFGWKKIDDQDFGPHAKSPYSEAHLRLFDAMGKEYAGLKRIGIRLVLGGEEALSISDPTAPIVNEAEFISLLASASRRGLLKNYDPNTSPKIKPTDSETTLAMNLAMNGIKVSDDLFVQLDSIKFSDKLRATTLTAAVYKLGVMLALTEQLTFDAKELGVPISSKYKPPESIGTWEANWQSLLGEPMPDIAGLYRQAHAVFVENASQKDTLVEHLFAIKELPHLK